MILSNVDIRQAIADGRIVIDPAPMLDQFDVSALDLRVGDDFGEWDPAVVDAVEGVTVTADSGKLKNMAEKFLRPLQVDPDDGSVLIKPNKFVLVRTLERVHLPFEGRVAARLEGRSTLARLGVSVHLTAPTVHIGWDGRLTLEIKNHHQFTLKVWPRKTRLCQLIFEEVSSVPEGDLGTVFQRQDHVLGKLSG